MKQTIEEKLNNEKVIQVNPFEKKFSRADLTYVPLCKDLRDVVYTGDLSQKENRDILTKALDNYMINE